MQLNDFLKDLSERLGNALPSSLQSMKSDWEKTTHSVLTSAFSKLDLITREEFDAQTKVLARTRKKVELLEAKIAELEDLLRNNSASR